MALGHVTDDDGSNWHIKHENSCSPLLASTEKLATISRERG
jgi:hypothetical protein